MWRNVPEVHVENKMEESERLQVCSQMDLHLLLGLFSCSLERVLLWTVVI